MLVNLGPRLDSAAAEGLRDEVCASPDEDLVLECSQVEQLGGLCLEVVMIATSLRHQNNKTVRLDAPSTQMIEDLSRFGLTPDTLLEITK